MWYQSGCNHVCQTAGDRDTESISQQVRHLYSSYILYIYIHNLILSYYVLILYNTDTQ